MKITCHCGQLIVDQTDDLPQKAHLIPDQKWLAMFDAIETEVIDPLAARRLTTEGAYMRLREIMISAVRMMWQCSQCGRLYVDDHNHRLQSYLPEDDNTEKRILAGSELHDEH
jgi:hypothetical protein